MRLCHHINKSLTLLIILRYRKLKMVLQGSSTCSKLYDRVKPRLISTPHTFVEPKLGGGITARPVDALRSRRCRLSHLTVGERFK